MLFIGTGKENIITPVLWVFKMVHCHPAVYDRLCFQYEKLTYKVKLLYFIFPDILSLIIKYELTTSNICFEFWAPFPLFFYNNPFYTWSYLVCHGEFPCNILYLYFNLCFSLRWSIGIHVSWIQEYIIYLQS